MQILKQKKFMVIFGASFAILFLAAGLAYISLADLANPLIVHFDAYKGIDLFGNRGDVFGILAAAGIMVLINMVLTEIFLSRQPFLAFIAGSVSLILPVLTFIAVLAIIRVN